MVICRAGVLVQVPRLPHVEGACAQVPGLLLGQGFLGHTHLKLDVVDGVGGDLGVSLVIIRLCCLIEYILKLGV